MSKWQESGEKRTNRANVKYTVRYRELNPTISHKGHTKNNAKRLEVKEQKKIYHTNNERCWYYSNLGQTKL